MNDEFMHGLRIPKERIPVLIGTSGETKKQLEELLRVIIDVDSEEGDVQIIGSDGLAVFTAREVVKAISRGFNPEFALLLTKQDYSLELIEIKEFAKNKKQLIRKRGRVIGEKGRGRRTIENLTDTHISVYGKTVGIIGRVEDVIAAKRAVEALLGEATHASVYKMLEKRRRELRKQDTLWVNEDISDNGVLKDETGESSLVSGEEPYTNDPEHKVSDEEDSEFDDNDYEDSEYIGSEDSDIDDEDKKN